MTSSLAEVSVELPQINGSFTGSRSLTLAGCVNMALDRNPDILRAKSEIQKTTGLIVEAKSAAIPKITTNGIIQWQDADRLEGADIEPYYWDVGIRAREPIYSGGQIISSIQEAKFTEQAALLSLQNTIDQTILNVRQAFNAILLNRSLIIVASQNVDLLTEEVHDQESRLKAGTVTNFNVLRAEVDLANARPTLIHARNNLRIALAQLAKLLSIPDSGSFEQPSFDIQGELPAGTFDHKYEEALSTALAQRSDFKALESRYQASKQQVKVAQSGYQPELDAYVGYDDISSSLYSFGHQLHGGIAGVEGSWNIFDGQLTKGRVEEARAGVQTAIINIDDARHQVELDVRQAYSAVIEAQEFIESQKKNVESATESLRLARARFDAGAGTQLDVLDSNVALTTARTNELQSRADFNNAVAQLERAMGIITTFQGAKSQALKNSQIQH